MRSRGPQEGPAVLVGTISAWKSIEMLGEMLSQARHQARTAQRPARTRRARGRDRRPGGPHRLGDDRHQHGRPRHRHHPRRQPRDDGLVSCAQAASARRRPTSGEAAHRRDLRPSGAQRRGGPPAGARGGRPAHRRHRAPRGPPHRQPAPRPLRPPGRPGLEPVLPVRRGRPDAHLRRRVDPHPRPSRLERRRRATGAIESQDGLDADRAAPRRRSRSRTS